MSSAAATTIRFEAAVPQFTVSDVVRTAEYYRDVLGFQITGYWASPPVFAIVTRDRVEVIRDCNGLVLAFGEDTSRRATGEQGSR